MQKKRKLCLVGSSGGHLTHLYMLKPFWQAEERFWITFDKEDARSLLKGGDSVSLLLSHKPESEEPGSQYSPGMEDTEKGAARFDYFLRRGGGGAILLPG